jgi:hypothetical protein
MPSSELADRSHHVRGDWLRALAVTIAIPVLVVASVVIGAPSSQGAQAARDLNRSAQPAASTSASVTATPPPVSTTTTAVLPTTTTPPPTPPPTTTTTPPAPVAPSTSPATPSVSAQPSGYGCPAALAYLAAHAAAGFSFECPGYADGNEAMTCVNHAPECAGEHLIVISDPCPAAYMNEAFNSNSWSDATDSFTQGIDPYGSC